MSVTRDDSVSALASFDTDESRGATHIIPLNLSSLVFEYGVYLFGTSRKKEYFIF